MKTYTGRAVRNPILRIKGNETNFNLTQKICKQGTYAIDHFMQI